MFSESDDQYVEHNGRLYYFGRTADSTDAASRSAGDGKQYERKRPILRDRLYARIMGWMARVGRANWDD